MDKVYLVMNKPAGYVCSAVSDSHKTVYSLLSPELQALLSAKRGERLHTVGRLDCDTSGLLIFTTDGDFSNQLTRPESHVTKQYLVTLRDEVSESQQLEYKVAMKKGVVLPAEKKAPEQNSAPAEVEFISNVQCLVNLSEGKFHQVKRMFHHIGCDVLYLKRVAFGPLTAPDLAPGEARALTEEELASLRAL